MYNFIDDLIEENYLRTPRIIHAFRRIQRRDFLPNDIIDEAPINEPLPIGHGQTNSQPLTVALMLELLQPKEGEVVLDIGAGSGWTTALLADIVGPNGKVYAIERIPELKKFGEDNVRAYHFTNVEFFCQDGSRGLSSRAPFDRIMVGAAAFEVPEQLKSQLRIGGRLVIPTTAEDLRLIEKTGAKKYEESAYPGFIFVPLIEG